MKNSVRKVIVGRNAAASLLLVFGILFLMGFACGGGSKPAPSEYVGAWTGDDGSTITIRSDGSADYKSGNTSVSGGGVDINESEKTLKITFAGMGPSFKIDKAPSGNQMTLSGVVYKKGGSSSSDSSSSKSSDTSSSSSSSNSEAESAVKGTLAEFTDAVDDSDFSTFYNNASTDFKSQYTKAAVSSTFQVFVDKKEQALPSLRDAQSKSASFTSGPTFDTEKGVKTLVADGEFPSRPTAVDFETKYEWEGGKWKMLKFKVKMQ